MPRFGLSPITRWYLWWMLLLVWSIALVVPRPDKQIQEHAGESTVQWIAHATHLGAYAGFAMAACWMPASRRRRLLLIGVLSFHAFASEAAQTLTSYRHGSWRDVGLDHMGIGLGLAVAAGCLWVLSMRRKAAATQV